MSAQQYDARFAALADAGADVHGEASFLVGISAPPGRVIDAGCGTGRVSLRLAELGYECVGVDADLDMLGRAVAAAPTTVRWVHGDVTEASTWRVMIPAKINDRVPSSADITAANPHPQLPDSAPPDSALPDSALLDSALPDSEAPASSLPRWIRGGADLVVLAGNVIPLLAPATVHAGLLTMAATLRPGGALVAGFGLDAAHLPQGCPPTELAEFDAAAESAGLLLRSRHATWAAQPWDGGAGGYAVSVFAR